MASVGTRQDHCQQFSMREVNIVNFVMNIDVGCQPLAAAEVSKAIQPHSTSVFNVFTLSLGLC